VGDRALHEINPVFGAGTGDVNDLMSSLVVRTNPDLEPGIFDPHNQFLHTWLALGMVGLLTLMAVLVVPMYFAYRKKYFLTSAFISLFLLVCLTESALEVQKGIVLFALFNSLFLFQQKGLQEAPRDEVVFA
jgi:O-antigen ligase